MISIIVPTRNRPHLLAVALASIQAQSYSDYEVWVVDDASDAATLASYASLWASLDDRFKRLQLGNPAQPRGVGPSASRNLGVAASGGHIIAFCDDDDLWVNPEHLASMAAVFDSQPKVDMYIANQRACSVDGTVRDDWLPALSARAGSLQPVAGGFLVPKDVLTQCGGFAHLNMLSVRRSVFDYIQGFWESVSYEEDRDFFWRCADACRALVYNPAVAAQHNVPNPQLKVNASTTHSQRDRWLIAALVCRHIAVSVQHRGIAALAIRHEGDLLRRLTQHAQTTGQQGVALALALEALALRFSAKWAAYCLGLWVRNALGKLRPGR